eukprot:scpid43672/ scgid25899/ JmjC domain-containing protein 8; Jumonji domain-containing protein 8
MGRQRRGEKKSALNDDASSAPVAERSVNISNAVSKLPPLRLILVVLFVLGGALGTGVAFIALKAWGYSLSQADGGRSSESEGVKTAPSADDSAQFLRVSAASRPVDKDLQRACLVGDASGVGRALARGADVCSLSAQSGQTIVLTALAQRQSSLSRQSSHLPGDYEEIVSKAVQHEGFKHCSAFQCPVYFAVHYRNMIALKAILDFSPPQAIALCIEQRDSYNRTVFHTAAADRAAGFARLFMQQIRNSDGQQVDRPAFDLLNLSIPTPTGSENGSSLDHSALDQAIGHLDMETLLMSAQSMHLQWRVLSQLDGLGQHALHVAAAAGRKELVRYLVDQLTNDDVLRRNQFGQTPYDVAAVAGFADVAGLLLPRGAAKHAETMPSFQSECQEQQSKFQMKNRNDVTHSEGTDNGGWNSERQSHSNETNTCGFLTIDASEFTRQLFLHHCVACRKPLLVKNIVASWPTLKNWRRDMVLARFGEDEVTVNTIPYGDQYGNTLPASQSRLKLKTFISKHMPVGNRSSGGGDGDGRSTSERNVAPAYVFDGKILHRNKNLWRNVDMPAALHGFPTVLKQLIVGPSGAGSPPHFHGLAVNFLAFGRKRWLLAAPSHAQFTTQTALEWFQQHDRTSNPAAGSATHLAYTECVQSAGDALVVPDSWGHAVLNQQNSIAVAVELAITRL